MYFPLICTWMVNAGSTVGKDSVAMEPIFDLGVIEERDRFSVGVVDIGVGDRLTMESVADRIYWRNPEKIFILVIANYITYIPTYPEIKYNSCRTTWIVGIVIRPYFSTPCC